MIIELEQRLKRLEAKVNQIVRHGTVTSTNPSKGTVRVKLMDTDRIVSWELPVLSARTFNNKSFDLPDINEQVMCIFLPNGMEQGFVIGSVFSSADPPPVSDQNKKHYAWPDGTWLEYDRAAHKLTGNVNGVVELTAQQFDLVGPVMVNGTLNVTGLVTMENGLAVTGTSDMDGDINASGSIIDGSGNTNNHSHP